MGLSELNFSSGAAALPMGLSEKIYECSKGIADPSTARRVYDEIRPILANFRADKSMAIAYGLLLEKQRGDTGMRELWHDLQKLYPNDDMALRMLMRWYRREGRTDTGIAHVKKYLPRAWHQLKQTKQALLGLSELKAWDEIDRMMETILFLHPEDRSVRMAYIKALNEQCRFVEASYIAAPVSHRDRMGHASQSLLASVERNAETLIKHGCHSAAEAVGRIIEIAGQPRPYTGSNRIILFSGQLGTGGAERQMTRIACAFKKRCDEGADGAALPEVWVKHANQSSGGDYYRPMLDQAGVVTRVMTEERLVEIDELDMASGAQKELLDLLAPDIQRHTCQLALMFRDRSPDVAYLWQDGGIVQSAIAAVLAGVPRIVTSFRGLPPNIRRNFYRDELPVLYKALAKLPQVTFTANSRKTAKAYEAWLDLSPGTVTVIANAIPTLSAHGDDEDHECWEDVLAKSDTCTRTVLGVFRMDTNKRPLEWIKAAERHLKTNPSTRFVILGNGVLFDECQALIEDLSVANRVFLAGVRENVGFYMHRSDLLMHLAQMEGLPNVLIEAQIAGTPVIATPAGGTSEVVNDGQTGIILSNAEVLPEEELDRQLRILLSDDDELARLGSTAMWQTAERFSVDTILDKTLDHFDNYGKSKNIGQVA